MSALAEVEALGHTAGEPVIENEKAATCEDAGSYDEVVYCTVCKEELSRETKTVDKLGHEWGEWTVTTEPTCTEKGEETRVCAHDKTHVEKRDVEALGHTAGEPVRENEVAATCEEAGSYDEVVYCTVCKEELSRETKSIEALGHDWGEWKLTTEPTCTEKGEEERVCSRDKSHVEKREVEALGHKAGEPVRENEVAATCEDAGSYDEVVYCSVCGEELSRETKTVEALGHDWGKWTVTTEPTCTEKGEETRVCAHDEEHVETREIEALGHDYKLSGWTWTGFGAAAVTFTCSHDEEHSVTVNATIATTRTEPGCETQGRIVHTATAVFEGETYTDTRTETIPALGHEWGPWTVTKEATEDEEGEETRSCLRDPSHVETRSIARLEPTPAEEETREVEPEPSEEPVVIPEEPVPQAEPEEPGEGPTMAIANLVLMAVTVLAAVAMVIEYLRKKLKGKLYGLIPAATAIATFFLTEQLNGAPVAADKWTPVMAGLLAASGVIAWLTNAKKTKV